MYYLSPNDPAAKAALAYLEGVGVPPPSRIIDEIVQDPLGNYPLSQYVWDAPDGSAVSVDIWITALIPKITQFRLFQAGFPVPDPGPGAGLLKTPASIPAPTLTPVKPAIPLPISPIGTKRAGGSAGTAVEPGDKFDAVGGYNFQTGQVWQAAGHTYILQGGIFNEYWLATS